MENEEILIPTKAVTPIGDFGCQSFPLIEGNVYNATEEELIKLGSHELKWSTEEYEDEEPVYEDVEEQREVQVPDETKPIERDGIIVGYENKTLVFSETKRVQVGTRTVTKTRPILVANDPTEENVEKAKDGLRAERAMAFRAFDIYKSNVEYGVLEETESEHDSIVAWYNACLELDAYAIGNVPIGIKRYM